MEMIICLQTVEMPRGGKVKKNAVNSIFNDNFEGIIKVPQFHKQKIYPAIDGQI